MGTEGGSQGVVRDRHGLHLRFEEVDIADNGPTRHEVHQVAGERHGLQHQHTGEAVMLGRGSMGCGGPWSLGGLRGWPS